MAINEDLSNYINAVGVTQEEVRTLLFGNEQGEVTLDADGKIQLTEEQVNNLQGQQLVWLRNLYQDRFDQVFPYEGDWDSPTDSLWSKIYSVDNWDEKKAPTPEIVEKSYQWDVQQRADALLHFINNAKISAEKVDQILDGTLGFNEAEEFVNVTTINITAEQAKNLTGKQLLDLQLLNPQKFDKQFKNDPIVNDLLQDARNRMRIISDSIGMAKGDRVLKADNEEMITNRLYESLSQFDDGYIEANKTAIAANMTKSLLEQGSKEWIGDGISFDERAITKVENAVRTANAKPNENYIKDKIIQGKLDHESKLNNDEIAARLSKFLTTVPNKQGKYSDVLTQDANLEGYEIIDPNREISLTKLAEARKLNPRKFDEIMFPKNEYALIQQERAQKTGALSEQGDLTRSSDSLATDILGRVVYKLEKEKGVKLEKSQVKQIFDGMKGQLSEIDSRSLASSKDYIVEGLANKIYEKGTSGDKPFTLNTASFLQIVSEVTVAGTQQLLDQTRVQMQEITQVINDQKLSNPEKGARVMQFIAEQQLGEVDLKNLGFTKEQISVLDTGSASTGKQIFKPQEPSTKVKPKISYAGDPETVGTKITEKQLTTLQRLDPEKFKEIFNTPTILKGMKITGIEDQDVIQKLGKDIKLLTPTSYNPRHTIAKTDALEAKKEAFKKRKEEEAKSR